MHDDLNLPDFLNRKLNPVSPPTTEERREWLASVAPAHTTKEEIKLIDMTKEPDQLTHGEQDELIEIKAMVKTSLDLAKRMATEWVTRTLDRKAQARRRLALKAVKGLHRRT